MNYSIINRNGYEWIHVKNDADLEVVLSTCGASIYSLKVFGEPVILEFTNLEDFIKSNGYHGKTLGRVAGRIKSPILIDNVKYDVKLEPGYDYSLHGGSDTSLSYKNFNVEVISSNKKIKIIFETIDKDLENGFPGNVKVQIIYEFARYANEFKIYQKAHSDKKTYINLSNHLYFIFNNDINLDSYNLKMNSSYIGDVDETIFITKKVEVPSYLDFRNGASLKEKMDEVEEKSFLKTIDNTFIFDETVMNKRGKVVLSNDKIELTLTTNYPAMNIYVDNSLRPFVFKNNQGLNKRRGIALEPQLFDLDLESITFDKGKKYNYFNKYVFKKLGEK